MGDVVQFPGLVGLDDVGSDLVQFLFQEAVRIQGQFGSDRTRTFVYELAGPEDQEALWWAELVRPYRRVFFVYSDNSCALFWSVLSVAHLFGADLDLEGIAILPSYGVRAAMEDAGQGRTFGLAVWKCDTLFPGERVDPRLPLFMDGDDDDEDGGGDGRG